MATARSISPEHKPAAAARKESFQNFLITSRLARTGTQPGEVKIAGMEGKRGSERNPHVEVGSGSTC